MSRGQSTREDGAPLTDAPALDADLAFLSRFTGPLMLVARAMLAYIFVVSGVTYIGQYAGVVDYMQSNGVTRGCCRWSFSPNSAAACWFSSA
jgi:uncharacterized membrane protein YphA (DoxX/SURF4 family)